MILELTVCSLLHVGCYSYGASRVSGGAVRWRRGSDSWPRHHAAATVWTRHITTTSSGGPNLCSDKGMNGGGTESEVDERFAFFELFFYPAILATKLKFVLSPSVCAE